MSKDTNLQVTNTDLARGANAPEQVSERPVVAPPVDVFENTDEYLVVADVPGVAQDQLEIHLDDGKLTLFARRSDRFADATPKLHEHRAFDFRRSFALPEDVDVEKTDAKLEGGVLTIHVPKAAAAKPRRIPVRTV